MSRLVILVRHGETALNRSAGKGASANEKIRGWLDIPLDATGIRQAAEAAKTLTSEYKFDEVISSNLKRALTTAKYIAAACHAPIDETPALRPWDVGRWAGKPVSQVLPGMKKLVEHPDMPAPGGESFGQFAKRFLGALSQILAYAKEKDIDLCVVTHTRNLQLTKAWIDAGAKADLTYDAKSVNDYTNEVSTGDWLTLRAA